MPQPHLFWRLFAEVCAKHDAILQLVISQMPSGASGCLRQVNRAMRAAVNRTVTSVTCSLTGPRFEGELAASFPQANKLRVIFDGPEETTHADVGFLLEYILDTSPALVSKLVALELDLGSATTDAGVTATVARFLSRCSNAQENVMVTWRDGQDMADEPEGCWARFQGQGSTNEERRSSMQRQLAALCNSTQFLAPSSWPTCNVLVSCHLSTEVVEPALYMDAASRTTSLVSLDVCANHVACFTSLSTLGSLQNLTQLQLRTMVSGTEPFDPVLEAIGQLSKLQHLTLDASVFGTLHPDVGTVIPDSWSGLQGLQQFELFHCSVGMPSLCRLACLTSLEVTLVSEVEDVPPSSSAALEVPQRWREALQHLTWGNCNRSCLPILSQLTSLSSLHLEGVYVSPELVRVLGTLPLLAELRMWEATASDLPFNRSTTNFRPKLPSLTSVAITTYAVSVDCLDVLARWSDVPTKQTVALTLWPGLTHVTIQDWGGGWVTAALASRRDLTVLLADDGDIALYVRAVAATASRACLEGCEPTVVLGESVTPTGFSHLLCAAQLPSKALHIGGPYAFDGVHARGIKLSSAYVLQLCGISAPGLYSLHISDCSALDDQDVAVLVGVLPGLHHVHLGGAAGLTDLALTALLGCPQLESVRLGGATKLTAGGVVVVLMLLKGLRELCLDNQQGGELGVLVSRVRQCMPAAAAALWVEGMVAAGDSATWTKEVA